MTVKTVKNAPVFTFGFTVFGFTVKTQSVD